MENEINLELKTTYVQSKVISLVKDPNTGGGYYFLDIDVPEHKTKIDRWEKYELTDKDIHIPPDGDSLRSR
jgi:hypothetical protein